MAESLRAVMLGHNLLLNLQATRSQQQSKA